jgi:predicted ester cyclase
MHHKDRASALPVTATRSTILDLVLLFSIGAAFGHQSALGATAVGQNVTNVQRAQHLIGAFNSHDVTATLEYFDLTATWNRGSGRTVHGRDVMSDRVRDFFAAFPDATLTNAQYVPLGAEIVVVEWTLAATHRHDWRVAERPEPFIAKGASVRVVGADVLRFNKSGLIVSDDSRGDIETLFAQINGGGAPTITAAHIREFAERYTAAWCSQKPESVASFYSEHGSLQINGGTAAVGRAAVTASAQSFMTAFPDMRVIMDDLRVEADRAVYQWTLTGTNSGPGGTGKRIHFRGFELWRFGRDGLIAESRGHYDSAVYEQQVRSGVDDR